MRFSAPALTLAAFLAAAALIFGGGMRLARREREVRVAADRTALRDLARSLQSELARLEAVYLADLREAAGRISSANPDTTRKVCAEFVGIRASCELRAQGPATSALLRTDSLDSAALPAIELASPTSSLFSADALVLPRSVVFPGRDDDPRDGWIADPRRPFVVFWNRHDATFATALLIDRHQVAATASAWLRRWIEPRFAGVLAARGLDRIEAPDGTALAGLAQHLPRAPDFVIPLSTRLGDWQAVSWDRFEMHTEHQAATLTAASASAIVLALVGVLVARQQARSQRLAEQRVSFVNRVSHELGAPLTNMLLNLDLAHEALDTEPTETGRRLGVIREEAQRLGRLVGNVLTFSRRERRTLKARPTPCLPRDVVNQVLEQFAPSLKRHGIAVEFHDSVDTPLLIDPDALSQIVSNLVSNVEKYAASGQLLEVHSLIDGPHFVLRVADRGPGIPTSARARIFEPFERATDRVTEGATGAGLGLAIARDLATLMGGTLLLLPSPQGALFELRLPA
jgi:signal transduction histidine kinase